MTASWTPRELATLAALATAFVDGDDAERRAGLAAEALERAADPSQVQQMRLVLRAFESRVANLALGNGATPFSRMSADERERLLLSWASSRIPQRRTVFHGLRKLLTFLAYADPGLPGSANPRHAAIGYRMERPAPAPPTDRTRVIPTALPFDEGGDEPMHLDADVVVVGSGAGGGVVAKAVADAGRSVVVLDAGPFVDEASMPTNELDAFSQLYLNHGLLTTWDGAITLLAGSAVGGGTLVNWMTTIAAPAEVREEWRNDHGLDGLADGEVWDDDVAVVERELGVTATAYLPPKDEAILRGAATLGWEAARIRRNGPACDDCGSCAFGCPRGAKRSGIRSHLADAFATGARIVPRVRVTRVLLDSGRAVGVEGLALVPDPITGAPIDDVTAPGGVRVRRLQVHAPQVVIAAGALRTPAVLQGSGLEHPAIGHNLRVHPVTGALARMATPVELWRGPMQGARSAEFITGDPGRRGYLIESAPGHAGLLALAAPWEGRAAHQAVMDDVRHLGVLLAIIRDGGEGRTTVTRSGRVRIDYRLDPIGVATLRHGAAACARLARAAGALDVMVPGTRPAWFRGGTGASDAAFESYVDGLAGFDYGPNRAALFSAHQMGTARMGASPADHACDPGGRVRRSGRSDEVIGGLYVADTSLFPTGLGVNPMLTVMALARRVSRTILAEG